MDCANGFLKIRASDGCGSSNDYFTLQTSVSGSYYAVDFKDNTVSFEARTASGGNTRQLVKKDNAITKIEILNSGGTTVYSATADNSTTVSVPKERLSTGEYTAIIHSGSSKEEVPFAI